MLSIFLSPIKDIFFLLPVTFDLINDDYQKAVVEEHGWLQNVNKSDEDSSSWAKHHSSKQRSNVRMCEIQVILPLIKEPVYTLDTQFYCINIIKRTIDALNPGQVAVDVCDQHIFVRIN